MQLLRPDVPENFLRRYTDVPALVYLLKNKRITLLDPASWDDRNDSHFLSVYREKNHLKSLLALCFTQASETYHHWRVFSSGASGVCISFRRQQLLDILERRPGIRTGCVQYLRLAQAGKKALRVSDLPFLKRYPFEPEYEFRVIYESSSKAEPALDIPIPLSCIERVTLSPWLPDVLATPMKQVLRSVRGCSDLNVNRSTLISNERWKQLGDTAVGSRAGARR